MATESILKTVIIRTPDMGLDFVNALEKSVKKKEKTLDYKNKCTEVKRGSVKDFFYNY